MAITDISDGYKFSGNCSVTYTLQGSNIDDYNIRNLSVLKCKVLFFFWTFIFWYFNLIDSKSSSLGPVT